MLVRNPTVPTGPVVSRVNLAAMALLASLALFQVACHASGRSPHERREIHADAAELAKPDATATPAGAAVARRGPAATIEDASTATAAAMPRPIQGVWQMGDAPCDVPHPDSDGTLTITAEGWQGYEFYGSPTSVKTVSKQEWIVEGDESYVGSQHDHVSKRFALRGGVLTISEPDYVESYIRCKGV